MLDVGVLGNAFLLSGSPPKPALSKIRKPGYIAGIRRTHEKCQLKSVPLYPKDQTAVCWWKLVGTTYHHWLSSLCYTRLLYTRRETPRYTLVSLPPSARGLLPRCVRPHSPKRTSPQAPALHTDWGTQASTIVPKKCAH